MNYYQKYLKYKTKYIKLKDSQLSNNYQIGSGFTDKKSQIELVKLVEQLFWKIYDGDKTNTEKRDLSIIVMHELIKYCMDKYKEDALQYVKDRDEKSKIKMNKIQEDVFAEIKSIIPKDWEIIWSSSFSADIYLMNDSDIDFSILHLFH